MPYLCHSSNNLTFLQALTICNFLLEMTSLTKAMCWELVNIKNDTLNQVGAAFYRKPISNDCYEQREQNEPPMCKDDDDPNAAW